MPEFVPCPSCHSEMFIPEHTEPADFGKLVHRDEDAVKFCTLGDRLFDPKNWPPVFDENNPPLPKGAVPFTPRELTDSEKLQNLASLVISDHSHRTAGMPISEEPYAVRLARSYLQ